MPFKRANCYGYAWGVDYNFAPGAINDDEHVGIDLTGVTDVNKAGTMVMEACVRDGLSETAVYPSIPVAVFINTYKGNQLDYHFYRFDSDKWSHKMGNTGKVEKGIKEPVSFNSRLVGFPDPNGDLIIGQKHVGYLFRLGTPTAKEIIDKLQE